MMLTDEEVSKIIGAEKYIKHAIDLGSLPRSPNGRFRSKKYDLVCEEYECRMVIRQNIDRPCNFSVILVYRDPSAGDVTVVRYNGDHGSHRNRLEKETIKGPHIHRMTERYQLHSTHPDGYAVATDAYSDLGGAVELFLRDMNIRDIRQRDHHVLEDFR